MSRSTAAALLSAAIVGIAGGVGLALEQQPDAPSDDTPPSAGRADVARLQALGDRLLFAEPGVIHDGDVVRRWEGRGRPTAVARTPSGWIVATAVAGRRGVVDLHRVPRASGDATVVARLLEGWALDGSGTQVTGQSPGDPRPGVWALDGRRTASYDLFPVTGRVFSDWSADDVVFSRTIVIEGGLGDPRWMQTVWNPETDATVGFMGDYLPTGWERMRVSPDGRYAGGASNPEAFSSRDDPNRCLGVEQIPRGTPQDEGRAVWNSCDWRPLPSGPAWSPDGRRILAVPADQDPARPRTVGLVDALAGPDAGATRITVPVGTREVAWADDDDDAVVAMVSRQGGSVLSVCDATGCVELDDRSTGPVALG